ncbi:DinB family protein [Flavobacterium sp.]|uniref:DinB family protein n=1 Tax=Flavobacterium sp. TaxID=239 RepID=UPI002627470E|nr:DinB family protein [Flavobacterium sp.]
MMFSAVDAGLDNLLFVLEQLDNVAYTARNTSLSEATIGEHTRHIIEMFQCLEQAYITAEVHYDNRKRDLLLQTSVAAAIEAIKGLKVSLLKEDKLLSLVQTVDGQNLNIATNYQRELLYNYEHCIHHQALIKVALLGIKNIDIPESFGVARSTIAYRQQCAQ